MDIVTFGNLSHGDPFDAGQGIKSVLRNKGTQYPDTMMTRWRVNADVGKIDIERDKNPRLGLRRVKHPWIRIASQLLGEYRVYVVTRLPKQDFSITRKILVEFEPGRHPARLRGDGDDTFSRQFCGVTNRSRKMLRANGRDRGQPSGNKRQQVLECIAQSAEYDHAKTPLRDVLLKCEILVAGQKN